MKHKIAIIGAGNMGQAIAQGLLSNKIIAQNQLFLTNSKTRNNHDAVKKADVIILAVKPQVSHGILQEIKDGVKDQLIISIMAGISIHTIQQALGKKAIVRVMPNLGAKVGLSMSVWVKSKEVTKNQKTVVKDILNAIGQELEVDGEEKINIATAISGSGPAYFFYFTELLEQEAIKLGFSQKDAQLLAVQTLQGSAELLRHSKLSTNTLRLHVTSKGGTTEAAFEEFAKNNFDKIFQEGVQAAKKRAEELNR